MKISISSIFVGPRLRKVSERAVTELAVSMEQLGLLQPVGVKKRSGWGRLRYELSYGLHRLLAAKELGWREIECTVVDSKLASKGQIVENTHRAELSALEGAEHTAELYRLAKADGAGERKNSWGRGRPMTTGDVVNAMPLSGSPQARKKRVQRARKVAKLPKAVKRAAKTAKLDNNLATLIKIADLPDVRSQLNLIKELSQAEKPKQRAPRGVVQLAAPPGQKVIRAKKRKTSEVVLADTAEKSPAWEGEASARDDKRHASQILYYWRGSTSRKKFAKATAGARTEFIRLIQDLDRILDESDWR